ncbi:MAG: M23 family metallopeptidase [Anaerolineae bacterium]|nr:M23 family metallopeptidase [Anaerolineae bacterium]
MGCLALETAQPVNLNASFQGARLRAFASQDRQRHTVRVPIPLGTAEGSDTLFLALQTADGTETTFRAEVRVVGGGYGEERLELQPALLPLADPSLDASEIEQLRTLTSGFSERWYLAEGMMTFPSTTLVSAPYGIRRAFNDGPADRFHIGVDFIGAPGTPFSTSGPGVVVMVETLPIRGQTTVIDHGWGVYSVYAHQNDRVVQPGMEVLAGQIIGTIGASGRTTGSHLHWEVWVDGVPVHPRQWVDG